MNLPFLGFLRRQPPAIPVRYIVATSRDNAKARARRDKTTAELKAFVARNKTLEDMGRGRGDADQR